MMRGGMEVVDLRSDTVTRPTAGMREAIASARVGDDVYGDDPTVNALQDRIAGLFGKEAALFVPSGTMANQVSIRAHTEPGDEIIVESEAHIFLYEGGGFAALSGVSSRCVPGARGLLTAESVKQAVRPSGGMSHYPRTRLVCLENSANRGGGTVYPVDRVNAIAEVARSHGLGLHLDGARVFNAAIATGEDLATIGGPFDSISCCLSKGLGCPVGSLIVGSEAFIARAHRFRKMFGGGMRQAGMLAAAGLYALEHNVHRLADDHGRARTLAEALAGMRGVEVELEDVQTNMAYVDVSTSGQSAEIICQRLAERGVLLNAVSERKLRVVTHLDIDDDGIQRAVEGFAAILG